MTREEFIVFQESSFDSFCKSVIRNESVTAHREQKRKIEHEILYSMISEERLLELSAEDQYVLSDQVFYVNGNPVPVCDPVLGDYLAILPPDVRNVLLMDFFWDCKVLITYSEKSENNTLSDVKRILFDRYASTKMVRKFDK